MLSRSPTEELGEGEEFKHPYHKTIDNYRLKTSKLFEAPVRDLSFYRNRMINCNNKIITSDYGFKGVKGLLKIDVLTTFSQDSPSSFPKENLIYRVEESPLHSYRKTVFLVKSSPAVWSDRNSNITLRASSAYAEHFPRTTESQSVVSTSSDNHTELTFLNQRLEVKQQVTGYTATTYSPKVEERPNLKMN